MAESINKEVFADHDDFLGGHGFAVKSNHAGRIHFVSPEPIVKNLYKKQQVESFLAKEHSMGRLLDVTQEMFIFTRRKRKLPDCSGDTSRKRQASGCEAVTNMVQVVTEEEARNDTKGTVPKKSHVDKVVDLLTKKDLPVNHSKELEKCTKSLDTWLKKEPKQMTEAELNEMKTNLSKAESVDEVVAVLVREDSVIDRLARDMEEIQLGEVANIDSKLSPFAEYPPECNSNIYKRILDYSMDVCPRLTASIARLVIKDGGAVTEVDVLRITNTLAHLAHLTNTRLNSLAKLRSLTLKTGGLTDQGIGLLALLGVTVTPKTAFSSKDMMAEVGPLIMRRAAGKAPVEFVMDNVDFLSAGHLEHLMLLCTVQEDVDTSGHSTLPMAKEDALNLFDTEKLLMLTDEHNKEEKDNMIALLARRWGRVLSEQRPDRAAKLGDLLKATHPHSCTRKRHPATKAYVNGLHPHQETSYSQMIHYGYIVQNLYLDLVAEHEGRSTEFMAQLKLLQDESAEVEVREAAEKLVHEACQDYGEFIGHGDQLTVFVWQQIRRFTAQNVTAFGRLDYCRIFRIAGMHLKMKKVEINIRSMMPNEKRFDNDATMAKIRVQCGLDDSISNDPSKITSNDSSFERHSQFVNQVGISFGLNKFNVYDELHPELLDSVDSEESALLYINGMFNEFNIQENLFYNPELHSNPQESGEKKGEDDLFLYGREAFIR